MESSLREAQEALRQGRAAEARRRIEALTESGADGEAPWLLLAAARGAEQNLQGEEAALNRALDVAPRSVQGHLMKGHCRVRAGDHDLAVYYYRTGLDLAEGVQASPEVTGEIARAREALARLEARAHSAREATLTARGLAPPKWSPRMRHSLELAAGQRKRFVQQPTAFYYPELPQIQFFDPGQFSWAAGVEAAAGSIRAELTKLLETDAEEFRPYIQSDNNSVPLRGNKTLLNSRDWSVLSLCERGWLAPDLIERCPRTWETVLGTSLPRIAGWGPTVVFSMLKAGAHIAPHTGMFNTRLICHLPLIVPPGCRFRVGNEVREWEEGKLMIFDDTIEHEAWNDSAEDRVVLIFDIWRPELTDQEKYELAALFSD
ncbi:MAG TPA: aspartyl/asparaginyl beta-hydroxylase domain-containing protein [Allosphingosinicella sp.]|nr:aspartyl/asparaginyl beta-hydroxylase domain-containing protein [Allosphingosinicella sp.]